MSVDRQARVQAVADRYIADELFAGMEWRVDAGGETVLSGRAGVADVATRQSIPDRAIYRIYSMTKPIVSFLALQLIEQGKLRLYDMLAQFDSAFATQRVLTADGAVQNVQAPITVEHLLTHRAGFTYDFLPGCHVAPYYREADIIADGSRSLAEMMAMLAEQPLAFQPGSSWRYSVCTDVLAHVCQIAGNDTLGNLLRDNVFEPLSMTSTGFGVSAEDTARLMPMYGVGDLSALPSLDIEPQVLEPASVEEQYPADQPGRFQRGGHGLFATLDDYAAFARMLISGKTDAGERLVSSTMHEMLQTNRIPAAQLPLAIGPNVLPGYGWGLLGRVMLDHGQAMSLTGLGEFGWAGAASTYFWVDPTAQMSGVLMTQYLGATTPLTDDFRSAVYQALA